jgi:outer membrane protein TolC
LLLTSETVYGNEYELPCPQHTHVKLAPQVMSMREAVFLALRSNPDVRNAELQRVIDKFSLAVAYNQFEPQYALTAEYQIGTDMSPSYLVTPSVSITTPYGTVISTNVNETLDGSALATVTLTQPLLKGFGRDVTEAALYNAQQQEKINKMNLKNQVMSTIVQVVQAYTTVVQDFMNVEINELALRDAKTTLYQTLVRIKAGKLAPTEQDQQQTNVATQALALEQAKNSLQTDYQNLLIILGLSPNANVITDTTVHMPTTKIPCMEESINIALANNIAYQQQLINFKILERNLIVAEDAQKWTLDLTATASRDLGAAGDTGGIVTSTEIVDGVVTTTEISSGLETTKNLTLNLTVPIDNIPIKQQLVNAKIAIQQAKISLQNAKYTLVTNVITSYKNLLSLQEQIKISEYQVKYAQQSLDVAKIKYDYGRTTSFELTTLQTNLREAQSNLINVEISYINALEAFFQTLGTTLEKWCVIVDYCNCPGKKKACCN